MKPHDILVLGGTGFVGRHLARRLGADGHRLTLLSRNRDRHRQLFILPGVKVHNGDAHDPATLRFFLEGKDVVINLIGILNERGDSGRGFHKAHVEIVEKLIGACQERGVRRMLQMSAIGAGTGDSHYLRSRGEAEARVRDSGLDWTLFRPSVIFGPGDGLYFRFAKLLAMTPVLPIGRADARFQPVYVGDVAEAFARALAHPHTIGSTFELAGPEVFPLADLVRQAAQWSGRRRWVLPLPDALGWLLARLGEWLPGQPLSRDNYRSLATPSVSDLDGLGALGIVPTPVASVMPALLGNDGLQARLDRFRGQY